MADCGMKRHPGRLNVVLCFEYQSLVWEETVAKSSRKDIDLSFVLEQEVNDIASSYAYSNVQRSPIVW